MKTIFGIFIGVFAVIYSAISQAHLRWFVEEGSGQNVVFPVDGVSAFVLFGGLLFCAVCFYIERRKPLAWIERFPRFWSGWPYATQWRLLAFLFGITLLLNSEHNVFIAPNFHPELAGYADALYMAQWGLGLLCLCVFSLQTAGIALIATSFLFSFVESANVVVDYWIEFFGAGLALVMAGCIHDRFKLFSLGGRAFRESVALSVLRFSIGAQLMILAVHNKFMDPGMGVEFLAEHSQFNFVQLLGFSQFTDLHFVLSAGVAEFCFGLMLALGIATRFVTLIVAVIFSTTAVVMGLHELIGHLPIFAIAIILLTMGGGSVKPYHLFYIPGRAMASNKHIIN